MPDNCCVPLCCKSGYRVGADGRKVTFHNLPIKDPVRLKVHLSNSLSPSVLIILQSYTLLIIFLDHSTFSDLACENSTRRILGI